MSAEERAVAATRLADAMFESYRRGEPFDADALAPDERAIWQEAVDELREVARRAVAKEGT